MKTQDIDETLVAGDSHSIPAGVEHSIEMLEAGEAIDVYVPPRADFM